MVSTLVPSSHILDSLSYMLADCVATYLSGRLRRRGVMLSQTKSAATFYLPPTCLLRPKPQSRHHNQVVRPCVRCQCRCRSHIFYWKRSSLLPPTIPPHIRKINFSLILVLSVRYPLSCHVHSYLTALFLNRNVTSLGFAAAFSASLAVSPDYPYSRQYA